MDVRHECVVTQQRRAIGESGSTRVAPGEFLASIKRDAGFFSVQIRSIKIRV